MIERMRGAYPELILPLVILLLLGVDPLLRIGHPLFEVGRIERNKPCHKDFDGVFDKLFCEDWSIWGLVSIKQGDGVQSCTSVIL